MYTTIGHFGDESLQSVTCTDIPEQPRDRTCTKHKPMKPKKWP